MKKPFGNSPVGGGVALFALFASFGAHAAVVSLEELSAAIENAAENEPTLIECADVTFECAETITITKPITITSESGELPIAGNSPHFLSTGPKPFSLNHADAKLVGLTISGGKGKNNNTEWDYGGNIYIAANGGSVYNCVITDGALPKDHSCGANISIHSAASIVSNCVIRNGAASNANTLSFDGRGGGVYIAAGLVTHCVISNNVIRSPYSDHRGGGMGAYLAGGTLANSLVIFNRSGGQAAGGATRIGYGGAVKVESGTMVNCTVAGNFTEAGGGLLCAGVHLSQGGTIANCIIAGNVTEHSGATYQDAVWRVSGSGKAANFRYCLTDRPISGGDNCVYISDNLEDIGFRDAANGDFRPAFGSPGIDSGANSYVSAATDLAGNPRLLGGGVDIGAFEYAAGSEPMLAFYAEGGASGCAPFAAELLALSEGFAAPEYKWKFVDGATQATIESDWLTEDTFAAELSDGGYYDVTLFAREVGGDGEITSLTKEKYFVISSPNIYVFPPTKTDATPRFPYDNWERATTNLTEAFSAAKGGCTVWLANGVYESTGTFLMEDAITVRSVGGNLSEDDCVVRVPASGGMRPFRLKHSGACLIGLRISGGRGDNNSAEQQTGGNVWINGAGKVYNCIIENGVIGHHCHGGNVYMTGSSSVISNCIIRNGAAGINQNQYGTLGGGLYLSDGLATHCVISNNSISATYSTSTGDQGGGMGVYVKSGTLANSLIVGNHGNENVANAQHVGIGGAIRVDGGKVVNCTIAGNYTLAGKGVFCPGVYLYGGTVANCISAGNTTTHARASENDAAWYVFKADAANGFKHCVMDRPIESGEANVLVDDLAMLFADAASGDYTLAARSLNPAIDAGSNELFAADFSESLAATDLRGFARINHSTIDAGCYEGLHISRATLFLLH